MSLRSKTKSCLRSVLYLVITRIMVGGLQYHSLTVAEEGEIPMVQATGLPSDNTPRQVLLGTDHGIMSRRYRVIRKNALGGLML